MPAAARMKHGPYRTDDGVVTFEVRYKRSGPIPNIRIRFSPLL